MRTADEGDRVTAPPKVLDLVERFQDQKESYKKGSYKEEQLRIEFINPFFAELGWDVENVKSYAEAYKEVVHEDALKLGAATKAPDYSFRIGGLRKFFVETKKPAVNIKQDTDPAFQLRRYAWSAKLPLSILTDFEEFAVYDCRVKPAKNDPASKARVLYLTFEEYEKRWEEIASVFSREAILKGSFDQYVEKHRGMRGTAEVDKAFLQEIERWRESLARNIALRNDQLTKRELNYAVQKTIDRIIFLRICEDRGIERYGRLMALVSGEQIYKRLFVLFREADDRYNSGIFHFRLETSRPSACDELTPGLAVDDKVLKDILKSLYYPESPYEFSVLPADILGQVYEQFLGKVIRLTLGHRAVVEEKPEVRKAGGVYYTPTYIVDYIVGHTVGELVKDKKPGPLGGVSRLRILDPACGSGSFLLGAYQYLLDWHLKEYSKEPERWTKGKSPRIYQRQGGVWALTIDERKRILLNNIYGVDIDPQAVEVTKLSLLLKVLEGEDEQSVGNQIWLIKQRALPDLGSNIKCGNSLIGPDFYQSRQMSLLDEEEIYRINAFDWDKEFKEIMEVGGFDAVIGNPPYLFITELNQQDKNYFFSKYETAEYRFDVYGLFTELGIKKLIRKEGTLGFIVPHSLLSNNSFKKLRKLLLETTNINEVLDIGPGVFENASNETMIFIVKKAQPNEQTLTSVMRCKPRSFNSPTDHFYIEQVKWLSNYSFSWLVMICPERLDLIHKLKKKKDVFSDFFEINQGLRTGNNKKYLSDTKISDDWFPAVGGKQVGRYSPLPRGLYVYYNPRVLDAPRRRELFDSSEKIVIQEVRNISLKRRLVATYDSEQFFCLQSTNVLNPINSHRIKLHIYFLLGLLNSSTSNYYFLVSFPGNNHIASHQLAQIPVPSPDKARHDQMVSLVETMLDLHEKLAAAKSPQEKTFLERQIQSTDAQIDQLVYELYGLTGEEIKIVEQATAS